MVEGNVTIECLADTSKFDIEMQKLEKKIDQAEKNKQLKYGASQNAVRELENYKQKIFEIEQEFEKLSATKEKNDAILAKKQQGISLTPDEFSQIENASQIANSYNKLGEKLDAMYSKQDVLTEKVKRTAYAYDLADDKVKGLKTDLELLNFKKGQDEVAKVSNKLQTSSIHLDSILKKTARWILALFSVRSVISMISKASSIVAQYDKQYASDLEYIQYALAMTIKPILEWIIRAIYTVLGLVNSIFKFFAGRDLFKSADAFMSAKKSLASSAKSSKEIKDNLQETGFDEITKLQSDTEQEDTGGTAGGGMVAPSGDLTKGFNVDWMETIKNFGEWVKEHWPQVVGILLTVGGVAILFGLLKKAIVPTTSAFGSFLKTIGKAVLAIAILRWYSFSYSRINWVYYSVFRKWIIITRRFDTNWCNIRYNNHCIHCNGISC